MKKLFKSIGLVLNKFNNFFTNNEIASFLVVFGFFLISFLLIYMNLPVLSSSDDHYFHFRFAERFIQNGFFSSFSDFKSIYFTNVASGEHLLYYNFLFYAALVPFTFITPLFLGIKLYAVVIISLIGVILFQFIKNMGIKYPFLWAVGFFASIGLSSFFRLFLSRPYVFSPLIILLLILVIHRKKYFWIFFLSFIPLFWHTSTFFVPILVAIVYFLVYAFYKKEYLWKELLLVFFSNLLSVIIAILIDPGFFISIKDNLFSVLSSVLNFSGSTLDVINEGGEVYPKNFFDLFNQNMFLCVMFLSASVIFALSFLKEIKNILSFDDIQKSKKIITSVFFVLSSVFIVAIPNISNRFADFFIFFAWIFIALIFSEVFYYVEFTKISLKKTLGYAVFVCLIYLFLNNGLQLNQTFANSGSRPETFSEIGNYLSKNLKKGEVVYNVTWNWFPQLYYYAPEQNYVIGLEPKLTYLYSPKIYWLWQNISKGYVCETEKCPEKDLERDRSFRKRDLFLKWSKNEGDKIANTIINDFKSHYVVSSKEFGYLNNVLDNNKNFKKVVNSKDQYFIYRILTPLNEK